MDIAYTHGYTFVYNKWIIRHGYRMDTSTWVVFLFEDTYFTVPLTTSSTHTVPGTRLLLLVTVP